MIELINVCKTYESTQAEALSNINLKINDGEFVYIIGPNGSGKSTLVKLLNCQERLTSGKINFDEYQLHKIRRRQIPFLRRRVGMVFQDFKLIEGLTVYENVAFALRVTDRSNREIRRKVPKILHLMGLEAKAKCTPSELSGGEQQKVGIARALVGSPSVIIADEPTGNVDPEMSNEILQLLDEINKTGTTVIMVTHHHDFLRILPRRVIMLKDGRIDYDYDFSFDAAKAAEYSANTPASDDGDSNRDGGDSESPSDASEDSIFNDDTILSSGFIPTEDDTNG